MNRLMDISFGFPTAFFTTLLLVSIGYWLIALIFGFADFGIDSDLGEFETGDVDLGSETNGSAPLAGLFRSSGIHHLPVPLAVSLFAVVGWGVSLLATNLATDHGGSTGLLVGMAIVVVAAAVGLVIAGRLGVVLRPFFEVVPSVRRADLIGRLCTIRTGRVDAEFGQAEVVDGERGTHLVQVRCAPSNHLAAGSKALIVDVDDAGLFVISPDVAEIL